MCLSYEIFLLSLCQYTRFHWLSATTSHRMFAKIFSNKEREHSVHETLEKFSLQQCNCQRRIIPGFTYEYLYFLIFLLNKSSAKEKNATYIENLIDCQHLTSSIVKEKCVFSVIFPAIDGLLYHILLYGAKCLWKRVPAWADSLM